MKHLSRFLLDISLLFNLIFFFICLFAYEKIILSPLANENKQKASESNVRQCSPTTVDTVNTKTKQRGSSNIIANQASSKFISSKPNHSNNNSNNNRNMSNELVLSPITSKRRDSNYQISRTSTQSSTTSSSSGSGSSSNAYMPTESVTGQSKPNASAKERLQAGSNRKEISTTLTASIPIGDQVQQTNNSPNKPNLNLYNYNNKGFNSANNTNTINAKLACK